MGGFNDKQRASDAGRKSKRGEGERAKQWALLQDAIMTEHTPKFNRELAKLEGEEFMKMYLSVLNYFKPKISYNINEEKEPITIKGITFNDKD